MDDIYCSKSNWEALFTPANFFHKYKYDSVLHLLTLEYSSISVIENNSSVSRSLVNFCIRM